MITEDDVKLTINSPDRVEDTIRGRKNVYKMLEGRTLKITYTQEDQDLVVVTAMVKGGK
jgi:MoaA/NifB/PqqE/SkfB family radical SAM enzyme